MHIKDSAYFEKLYRHDGRWDKYSWAINGHNAHGAIIFTADNDQHKVRRQPLNAYFSKARIADRQTLIQTKVGRLCERIAQFADTGKAIDLGAATSAFQRDISTKVVLNKDYGDLEKDDFGVGMTLFMQGGGKMWRLTKHIRWYGPAMLSIPKDFLIKNADANTANFMRYAKVSDSSNVIEIIVPSRLRAFRIAASRITNSTQKKKKKLTHARPVKKRRSDFSTPPTRPPLTSLKSTGPVSCMRLSGQTCHPRTR